MKYLSSSVGRCISLQDLKGLLSRLDKLFEPSLSSRVDLNSYARKIYSKASLELACTDAGKTIAMIAYYNNDIINKTAYITLLGVLPEYHGKGIASKLLDMCLRNCSNTHMNKIKVRTEKNNKAAIHLYKKKSFKVVDNCSSSDDWESIYLIKTIE